MARHKRKKWVRPWDLDRAPESDAVPLPPADEPYRGTQRPRLDDRNPDADAIGEGSVTELAEEMNIPEMAALERNAQRTEPRAAAHPHPRATTSPRPAPPSTGTRRIEPRKGSPRAARSRSSGRRSRRSRTSPARSVRGRGRSR